MIYDNDDLIIDDIIDMYENEWVQDSSETLDSGTYNVYQGTGESSLVKLLIRDEIIVNL